MADDLILSFPALKNGGDDFLDGISYVVEATQAQNNRKLYITHTLKGDSFISELIKNEEAKFSVSLFYKDNAERQNFVCEFFDHDDENNEITAEQEINIDFHYAPEITPNIVICKKDIKIVVDDNSGLNDFWSNEIFTIPAYARVAYYSKLKFTSGDVSSLIKVSCDNEFEKGSVKTTIIETAGEGEQPVEIICAQDVFDVLQKDVGEKYSNAKTCLRAAITTQVLCHVYAYMNNLEDREAEIHSGLLMHMDSVTNKTGVDWKDDNFNPSFAATMMCPYAIDALNKEEN